MKQISIIAVLLASLSGFVFADDPNPDAEATQSVEAAPKQEEKPLVRPAICDVFGPYEQWLIGLNVSQDVQEKINQHRQQVTENLDEGQTLSILTSMVIAADSRYAPLFEGSILSQRVYPAAQLTSLTRAEGTPEWIVNVMNLQAARLLANNGLYDDAAGLIQDLKPEHSPCPAVVLFYQGLVKYQSLDQTAAIPILKRLDAMDSIPVRYRELAQRMIMDLEKLEPKSLDHISRRMGDVAGRLDNGLANEKTVEIEDGIVKDLDEKIKKLEEQLEQMMQQQQQSSSSKPQPPQSEQVPGSVPGKGRVDGKDVGRGAGWGDLPEKEREKDLQQIQENFPPHYRDIIEQYFKRMSELEN